MASRWDQVMEREVVWVPSREYIEHSHLHRFMERHRIPSLAALHRRSVADRSWYWRAAVEYLGVHFYTPFEYTYDTTHGIAFARWFVGSQFNAAANCVDRHQEGSRRNQVALIWEGEGGEVRRLTYRDLHGEVCQLGHLLREQGVGIGDRVGIHLPMIPEAAVALLACAKIGAVAVPLFTQFGPEALAARLSDCAAKVLITADAFTYEGKLVQLKAVADAAVSLAASVQRVLVVRHQGVAIPWHPPRDVAYDAGIARHPRQLASERLDPEHPLLLTHTSGTTGQPKGIVHVHAGLTVQAMHDQAFCLDLKAEDTLFWATDFGWVMGPWVILGGLATGSTVLMYSGAMDCPQPDRLWSLIERHGVSVFGLSPRIIRSLMPHGPQWVQAHDLSSLRIIGCTGDPLTRRPYLWYFEHVGQGRCPLINLTGGAELGGEILSSYCILPIKVCSFTGPVPGMEAEILNDEGKPVQGAPGNLVLRGPSPSMTRGFFKDPERYLATYWYLWPDVWAQGDWASVDDEGYWYVHGRIDETIRGRTRRWGASEVEELLMHDVDVLEAAAVGVPGPSGEDEIVGLVVPAPGTDPATLVERLHSAARSREWPLPPLRAVHVVRSLPKTINAKIMRRVLRACYLQEDPGDLSVLENPESVEELRRVFARQE